MTSCSRWSPRAPQAVFFAVILKRDISKKRYSCKSFSWATYSWSARRRAWVWAERAAMLAPFTLRIQYLAGPRVNTQIYKEDNGVISNSLFTFVLYVRFLSVCHFQEGAQNMSLLSRNAVLKCIVFPFVPFDSQRPPCQVWHLVPRSSSVTCHLDYG